MLSLLSSPAIGNNSNLFESIFPDVNDGELDGVRSSFISFSFCIRSFLDDGITDPHKSFTRFYNLVDELYNKNFPLQTKIL